MTQHTGHAHHSSQFLYDFLFSHPDLTTPVYRSIARPVQNQRTDEIRHSREGLLRHSREGLLRHSREGLSRHSREGLSRHSREGLLRHSREGLLRHSREGLSRHSREGGNPQFPRTREFIVPLPQCTPMPERNTPSFLRRRESTTRSTAQHFIQVRRVLIFTPSSLAVSIILWPCSTANLTA